MCIDGTQKVWTFRESIKCQLLSVIFLIFKAKRKARTIFFPFQLLKYLVRINITHRQLHRFYLALSRIAKRLTDPLEHTLACSSTNLGKKNIGCHSFYCIENFTNQQHNYSAPPISIPFLLYQLNFALGQ